MSKARVQQAAEEMMAREGFLGVPTESFEDVIGPGRVFSSEAVGIKMELFMRRVAVFRDGNQIGR